MIPAILLGLVMLGGIVALGFGGAAVVKRIGSKPVRYLATPEVKTLRKELAEANERLTNLSERFTLLEDAVLIEPRRPESKS